MAEQNLLVDRFMADRSHLRAIAVRTLGSPSEAEDAVQETWLRLDRADTGAVAEPGRRQQATLTAVPG